MSENIIFINPTKAYFKTDEVVELNFEFDKDVSEFNFVKFEIVRIDHSSEYNTVVCNLITDFKKNEQNKYIIRLKADIIKEGIFFFSHIELLKQNKCNAEFPLKFDIYNTEKIKQKYFKIGKNKITIDYEAILKEVYHIKKDRDSKFFAGIGDSSKNKFYTLYFFIKNLYLEKRFTYGTYEIIPFDKYSISNIYDFINHFIKKEVELDVKINYDINDRIKYENPGLVIFFPKIYAVSETEAYSIGEKITFNLLKSFSLTRNTKGEVVSSIIVDIINKKLFYNKPNIFTARNIMSGEMFGESPFLNQEILNLINHDSLFSLISNLYNDLVNEQHVEIKYSKLWTILEVLAESKNYPKGILKKTYLDGTKFPKSNGNHQPTIKDKVRELFRENLKFNNFLLNQINPKELKIDKIDDLLTIWYRHRNCMVHSGGCQPENNTVCKNMPDYILCKSKHKEVEENHENRNIYNDTYQNLLESSVRCIVINYFIEKTNFKNINEHFFMSISEVPMLKFDQIEIENIGNLNKIITGSL